MPRNLREEIERMERVSAEKDLKNQQQRSNYESQLQQEKAVRMGEESRLLNEARTHFDRYLMPIFLQVAEAKDVPMRDPFKADTIKNLIFSKKTPTSSDEPKRSGYRQVESGLVVCGQLFWNIYEGGDGWGWSELDMGVNGEGKAGIGQGIQYIQYDLDCNVLTADGLQKLEDRVIQYVTMPSGGPNRGNQPPQFLSM